MSFYIPAFDAAVMTFVQERLHNSFTDSFFPLITYLGENGFIWIVIAILLLVHPKTRKCGVVCLCALTMSLFIGELFLKNMVERTRPCVQFPEVPLLIPRPQSFSFPSGHSCSSFAAATAVFLYSKKLGAAAFLLAALIAFSRVFLFVHYPTDIIGGMVLGICFGLFSGFLFRRLTEHRLKP